MDARERELLDRVAGHVLRRPDYPATPEVERLLVRMNAARGDVARVLLERVLVLEAALDAVREQRARESGAMSRAPGAGRAEGGAGRLLREAATVAAGVVGGTLALRGIDAVADDLAAHLAGASGTVADGASAAADDPPDAGLDWA